MGSFSHLFSAYFLQNPYHQKKHLAALSLTSAQRNEFQVDEIIPVAQKGQSRRVPRVRPACLVPEGVAPSLGRE